MNIALLESIHSGQNNFPETLDGFLDTISPAVKCKFNKYGSLLAIGCNDGSVIIWDFSTRQIAKTLAPHSHPITSICWSRNGHEILTTSTDKVLAIWNVLSGECQYRCQLASPILYAQFDPCNSSKILAMPLYEGPVLMQINENGENAYECLPLFLNSRLITASKFDNTGKHIYLGHANSLIFICESKSHNMITSFYVTNSSTTNSIKSLEFSKNNQILLVNASDHLIRVYKIDQILTNKLVNCKQQQPFQVFQDVVARSPWKNCCFSADAEYVCADSMRQHRIYIWETINGSLMKILHDFNRTEVILDLAWHPISATVISISSGILSIWTPRYLENISEFMPGFNEMETNEVYEERESEFDVTDEDKSIAGDDNGNQDKVVDELEDVDIETFDDPLIDDDVPISSYLTYIPAVPIIIYDNNNEMKQQINAIPMKTENNQQIDPNNDFIDILN